jgi:hypothetical protein
MLDQVELTHNSRHGVPITAVQLAERHRLLAERTSDTLDYFDFFALELDGVRFGFRTYFRAPAKGPFAYVTTLPRDIPNAAELIARLVDMEAADVIAFDQDW